MEYELGLRLGVFALLFAVFAGLEVWVPRRTRTLTRRQRWPTNLAITVLSSALLRFMAGFVPLLAIGAAMDAERLDVGLFNALSLPFWAEALAAILILDAAIWAQHVISHKVPLFWRFHRMHHADRDIDVTTAIRFHPIEIGASMGVKIGCVYLIGADPLAVLLFELLLNGTALFNHANLRLPDRVERHCRKVLVTPDMHRIHHSTNREEHDSNFGFALSIWDRIFGTYRPQPKAGHEGMTIGLEWQDERPTSLRWSLMLPFRWRG